MIPWRRKQQPTPVLLPGKSHGQRSLVDYSPWGHKRVGHNSASKQEKISREQHFWLVQLSAPISGSILGTKQILLTVVQTTPILTLLLTESNMKKLAMKAVFHLGTSLYTRLHRSVLTWVLKRRNARCRLSPGKWVLLGFWYLDSILDIQSCLKGYFCLMFLIPVISSKRKPHFKHGHRKLYPEDENCSLKWSCIQLLRMLEPWSPVIELGSFWACQSWK